MNGNFNGQILTDKLVKLNNSQQSIETLSHWCIFHRKNAKQVVETWARQFHCSPKDQRVSFLYLANDILQNSRWKGSEFVGEFWRVLPDALNDVLDNGDSFGRNVALRLIDIWEDRKVFGSRGQTLKEELLGRKQENHRRDGRSFSNKFKRSIANVVERIVLSFERVYAGPIDEDTLLSKCQAGITYLKEIDKETGNDQLVMGELKEKEAMVKECVQQLKAIESSRVTLILHLKEALSEQEIQLEKLRHQLLAAQSQPHVVADTSEQLKGTNNGPLPLDRHQDEAVPNPDAPDCLSPGSRAGSRDKDLSLPVYYTQEGLLSDPPNSDGGEQQKVAAAEVAAKLAASTCSYKNLGYTLSSLESKVDMHASDGKRLKVENDLPYTPPHSQQPQQPPPPPFPYPDSVQPLSLPQPSVQQPCLPNSHSSHSAQMPPLQPPLQPPHPRQFMQMTATYNYLSAPQWTPLPGYPMAALPPFPIPVPPPVPYQNPQPPEIGRFLSQPSLPATPPPISRQ